MSRLEQMNWEEIERIGGIAGTHDALYALLFVNPEVEKIRQSIISNEITGDSFRRFIADQTFEFTRGVTHPADIMLCALSVAVELIPGDVYARFLEELSEVRVLEMPHSPAVAKVALMNRKEYLSGTTQKEFRLSEPEGVATDGPHQCEESFKLSSGITEKVFGAAA